MIPAFEILLLTIINCASEYDRMMLDNSVHIYQLSLADLHQEMLVSQ